jgi:hypothetical protein
MVKEEKKEEHNEFEIGMRVIQSICFGVFALGLSMMIGQYVKYIGLPFSVFAISSTVFGLIGALITEIMSRQARKW